VGKIVGGLDLSYLTRELFRSFNVINYDIDFSYNDEIGILDVSLHGLRAEMAMDARDKDRFVGQRDIPNVSYDDVIGADGAKADNLEELETALKKAFSYDGPFVIDCAIDKDEFVLPMLPPGGSVDDIITKVGEDDA
jgi:hypothetical protein